MEEEYSMEEGIPLEMMEEEIFPGNNTEYENRKERAEAMDKKLYGLMNWPKIEEIIYSECDNPHELLGPHKSGKQTLVQAYFPGAVQADIIFDRSEKEEGQHSAEEKPMEETQAVRMELADEDGFFAALVSKKARPRRGLPL